MGKTAYNLFAALVLVVVLTPVVVPGQTIAPSPFWKNEIAFPDDPFVVAGTRQGVPGWVKFTILLDPYDPSVVYFQDGHKYPFHYDFAAALLDPFLGMTAEQFDQATLFNAGRKGILGAVVFPPTGGFPQPPEYPEYGIQFVGQDAFSREQIVELFHVVKTAVATDPGVQAFYFPSYEQAATARAYRDWFEAQGVPVSSSDRWAQGNGLYSEGWALGRLKYFTGHLIEHAYLTGQLEPNDILLTDGVPAEVPFVAGIITLSSSTPNSHVAILAKTSQIPFVYLAVTDDANRATDLVGRRIVLRAYESWSRPSVRLIDVEDALDDETVAEILQLKAPPALNIRPIADYGSYSANTDGLFPSDIQYFGGKAANFGILRTSIPENSPVAVAFSFRLWSEFLDQPLGNGRTLRQEIENRLAPFTYPPADMAQLSSVLDGIRDLFRDSHETSFTVDQQQAVIAVLQDPDYGLDEGRKIRFRSSTNVEDSEQFTGAGLYDSYSGCLADDLDGDTTGPSRCDPDQGNERGVFRAIRRVFSSFYNDNAYLERMRYGMSENEVGMALLVHHSFPDEIERANGVGTISMLGSDRWNIELVTQHGATPVTNPTDGSIPEQVEVSVYSFGTFATLLRQSNLVPLGATVLEWERDYQDLAALLVNVGQRYHEITGKAQFTLETEYKKVTPDDKLVIKQVREVPQPDRTPSITPFLVNEPIEYCTFQGEFGDVFANHRLKSRWGIETANLWLTEDNLQESFLTSVDLEYTADARVRSLSGRMSQLPFAAHIRDGSDSTDRWSMHHLSNPRQCDLIVQNVPTLVSPSESPILTLSDLSSLTLDATYDREVFTRDWNGPMTTKRESIRLWPCPQAQAEDLFQQRTLTDPNGVSIETSFYWPPLPTGPVAGYTAPVVRWVRTTIEGYTSEPVVLRGWYAQTYRPGHHNFDEFFLFEPQLDPNVPGHLLDELRQKDIRWIYAHGGFGPTDVRTYGFEDDPFLSGDLDGDKDVDQVDFALVGQCWRETGCDRCGGADLTGDGRVTLDDAMELASRWLDRIAP